LSLALAVIATVPLRVALLAGEVTETVGEVLSLTTVTETLLDCPTLPAASYAFVISVWVPTVSEEVFNE
jgi:hypothetical protein